MTVRLRQVALVVHDLERTVEQLCRAYDLAVAFHDPELEGFGLRNAVLPVGDTFLEVLTPIRPDSAGQRFLDRRGGDGGYMVVVQVPDSTAARSRAHAAGIRVVWHDDRPAISGTHFHPKDTGGGMLSVDTARPPESWAWAGPAWTSTPVSAVAASLAGVEVAAHDPAATHHRWAMLLGAEPAGCGIRFVAAAGDEGVETIELAAVDPARAGEERRIGGCRFRLV